MYIFVPVADNSPLMLFGTVYSYLLLAGGVFSSQGVKLWCIGGIKTLNLP